MKRIDEEQRFREEREAEKRERGRGPRKVKRARRDLAGRDALAISLIERTAPTAEAPAELPAISPEVLAERDRLLGAAGPAAQGVPAERLGPDPAAAALGEPSRLSRDVDAANRWRAYTTGWRVGARAGAPDPRATGHADRGIAQAYQDGYAAGRYCEPVSEVLHSLEQLRAGHSPSTVADIEQAIGESFKPLSPVAATFRPGMRRPGHKQAPPIPRWARKRGRR